MNPTENSNQNKTETASPIKSLRTFQGDVQEAIAKNNFSATTVLVAEQEKKIKNPDIEIQQIQSKVRNRTFLLYGIIIIAIGLTIASSFYYLKTKEQVVIVQKTKTLLPYNDEKTIALSNIDKIDFTNKYTDFKNSWDSTVNNIMYNSVSLNGNDLKMEDFISIIGPNMTPSLARSFGEKYMLGVLSFDINQPFIVMTVSDYSLAYPGMLKWEDTMDKDLSGIFEIDGEGSDTASTTENITKTRFIDETIKNKDIRALKDKNNNTVLLYSFIDRKTLVITKDEETLSTLVGSFIINQQIK